ncbi:ABC transporter ATP-binding protein [Alloscardovia venturai]|uniref:ABC transporter ATP-binding protein n=1 Tax=Alloscardovia venturai TaxID=1769421 RepID=A0ABW2Y5B4_9BIFI
MTNLIEFKNVSFRYGKSRGAAQQFALKDVSFAVPEGKIVALVGQSGSGKSTLVRLALGMLHTETGYVRAAERAHTGLIFQNPLQSLNPRWSVEKIVREGQPSASDEEIARVLEQVSLKPHDVLHKYAGDMSGGQAQRVAIARALISQPDLLIADEPLSAVDVLGKKQIIEVLEDIRSARSLAMLIVLHDLGIAQRLADEIVVLHEGQIVEQGSVRDIISHPKHEYTKQLIEAAKL